mgnify:CR=1 FL=1
MFTQSYMVWLSSTSLRLGTIVDLQPEAPKSQSLLAARSTRR